MLEKEEIYHKMSKKIAQLTKVIFHLNTKNDEADAHVKSLTNSYEAEIDAVIRDANSKLDKAWQICEKVKADSGEKQALKLKEKYEAEKADALRELENIKRNHETKEQYTFQHWSDKVSTLCEDLVEIQEKCAKQKGDFDRRLQDLEDKHGGSVVEMEARNRAEVQKARDESRQETVTLYEKKLQEQADKWKASLSDQGGKLNEQLSKLHEMLDEKDVEIQEWRDKLEKKEAEERLRTQLGEEKAQAETLAPQGARPRHLRRRIARNGGYGGKQQSSSFAGLEKEEA